MASSVTKIRLFISSPRDVEPEASQIPAIAAELNRTIGKKFDLFVEPVSWKSHCYPGMGRAQGIINDLIGPYDIFLGVMWNRFGTPTGEAESGTEEEFLLAYREWERDHNLPILFYFSMAPATLTTEDEISQRLSVIKFKNELTTKGLPWDYPSATEFRDIVRPHLSQLILDRFVPQALTDQNTASIIKKEHDSRLTHDNLTELANNVPEQASEDSRLSETFNALINQIQDVAPGQSIASLYQLTPFQIVRNHLLSTTLVSSQIPSSTLTGLETNQLYLFRKELAASPEEALFLFRAILKDKDNLITGWYWLRWLDRDRLRDALFERAVDDPTDFIRLHAWEMLSATNIPPPDDETVWQGILNRGLGDSYELVRRAVVSYLGVFGTKNELPQLEAIGKNDRSTLVRQKSSVSRILVLTRNNPEQVLKETLPELLSDKVRVIQELKANVERIDDKHLMQAMRHEDEGVRLFVLEELIKRGLLTKDLAASMVEDSSGKVSQLSYEFLIGQNENVDPLEIYRNVQDETNYRQFNAKSLYMRPPYADSQALILNIIRDYAEEELLKLAQWESEIGHIAYRALALYHFPKYSSQIVSELKSKFEDKAERSYIASLAKWKEFYSGPSGNALQQYMSLSLFSPRSKGKLDDYTPEASAKRETENKTNKYIAAALAAIAQHGNYENADFGRQYLTYNDYDVRVEAVRVLSQLGNDTDVPGLIDIAKTTDGILQKLAIQAALKWASDLTEVVSTLLQARIEEVARAVIDFLLCEKIDVRITNHLEVFLNDKSDAVRKQVIRFFSSTLSRQQLSDLLDRHMSRQTYYIDVVCWLDRALYAPDVVQKVFFQQLQND